MAISKVTLNGVTLMDVTSDTVEANNLLSGNTATKNDGTKVTGSYTPVTPTYQTKTITPTTSSQTVTPDSNYDALSQVTVNAIPSQYIIPSGTLAVTENGTVDVTQYASADIAVPSSEPVLQEKTATPTTSTQVITADSGSIYSLNLESLLVSSAGQRGGYYSYIWGISALWESTPIVGETYHINIDYYRGGYQAHYYYDADYTFNGFPLSLTLSSSSAANRTLVLTETEIYVRASTDDDTQQNTTLTYQIYKSVSYDGLSQVTVNPIPSEYVIPTGTLSVSQNGTVNVKNYEYANVNVEGGGTTADDTLPVRFLDYDGTVLYSYTAEDFANLSAMPSNPSHTGLTAQGWNWTLADAKAQVADMGECDIGQMYVTDDGKTRIYCHFDEGRLAPYLGICVNGTVVVDWGDGSSTDTLTGTSLTTVQTVQHTYASEGDYVIALTVSSGSFSFYGTSNTSYILRKEVSTTANVHRVYTNSVRKIELGNSANIGNYAFYGCSSLSSITIPSGITSIGGSIFYGCYSLLSITIPSGVTNIFTTTFNNCFSLSSISIPSEVTSIGGSVFYGCSSLSRITIPSGVTSISSNAFFNCSSLSSITIPSGVTSISTYIFYNCPSLSSITIPSGVTSIGNYAFYGCHSLSSITMPSGITIISNNAFNYCYSLTSITIPSGVTGIGNSALAGCYGVAEYHLLPTTPPTLGTTAFNYIQSDCKIYVPAESLEAYQTAENWSTYADYMVGE